MRPSSEAIMTKKDYFETSLFAATLFLGLPLAILAGALLMR
jgi:hypothetical protein